MNSNARKACLLPALLVGLLWMAGCRPARELIPVTEVISPLETLARVHARHAEFDFFDTHFSGLASVDGMQYNVGGQIRIRRDSAIYISVAPVLGIEVARLVATPDSLLFLNRLENTYYKGAWQALEGFIGLDGLDYYMLQALLVGNDFDHLGSSRFSARNDRGMIYLHAPARYAVGPDPWDHSLWVDQDTYRIRQFTAYEGSGSRSLQVRYPGHATVHGQLLPNQFTLVVSDPMNRMELDLRFSRLSINQPRPIRFSVPAGYIPLHTH